jgi:hypothetical protein
MAPEVGFEPTIRRGGLTASFKQGFQKIAAAAGFKPTFTEESVTASRITLVMNQDPGTGNALSELRGETTGIVVLAQALLQIRCVAGVDRSVAHGADDVNKVHCLKDGS